MNTQTHDKADRLYQLLPAVHRSRDHEQGEPLRALLHVIAEQVNLVEADIAQLYENWFIETCDDWVVPYLGDLIGYRVTHEAGEPGAALTPRDVARNRILIPRREVANTIRNRRRKGALALLELLAADVTGWSARAVEFQALLCRFQHLNYLRPERGGTVSLRNAERLARLDGPFDGITHTVDVRRVSSTRTVGRYNSANIGLFVWRLKAYPLTQAPAFCHDRQRARYNFSLLGNDAPLYTLPFAEPSATHIADEMNVPAAITRAAFAARTADYYGPGKSLEVWVANPPSSKASPKDPTVTLRPVRLEQIIAADLSDWAYRPERNQVAVDPVLGRIVFGPAQVPTEGVWVNYHYGFSADIGGGEYEREPHELPHARQFHVRQSGAAEKGLYRTITDALQAWQQIREQAPEAVIEIGDSSSYTEPLRLELRAGERLVLRACNGARPAIRLLDWYDNKPDALRIVHESATDEADSKTKRQPRLILDGLLIFGRSVRIEGALESVTLRHCTLVPGWSLEHDCEPATADEPSLELIETNATLLIEHCLLGTIHVKQSEVTTDPINICISDSLLDATAPEREALGAPGCPVAHAVLTIQRTTVIGRVEAHAIQLAENCIFNGRVKVARSQIGCMRFCYAPPDSRTPRRFNCQPDLAMANLKDADRERAALRVRPVFNRTRYGTPTYGQLAAACPAEITQGADDQSELGVFHDLYQPQRVANLRARLAEYTPSGSDADIIFAS